MINTDLEKKQNITSSENNNVKDDTNGQIYDHTCSQSNVKISEHVEKRTENFKLKLSDSLTSDRNYLRVRDCEAEEKKMKDSSNNVAEFESSVCTMNEKHSSDNLREGNNTETCEEKREYAEEGAEKVDMDSYPNSSKKEKLSMVKENEDLCSGCSNRLLKKLSCPVCLKNKIVSYFCSQECFKNSWKKHVKIHEEGKKNNEDEGEKKNNFMEIVKKELSPKYFNPMNRKYWVYDDHLKHFVNFTFTGHVRPWPISRINDVPKHIEKPDYAITSIPESELKYKRKSDIYINNEDEIKRIREACILGRKTLDYAHSLVSPGITTDEIDKKVHDFIVKHDAYPSTLNYYKFPKSCCTSVNEIVCHGIPDYRPLKNGDIINIDISVFFKGVHADLNETYFVGDVSNISNEAKELVQTCYFSLMEAIMKCKPGMLYKNIGNIIDAYVSKKNFSVVRTYSGHGVGKLFHSNPTIPHFRKNKAVGIMKPGHVFTIEPMINQGHYSDVLWPDKWTSATSDGKLSAQFEHTLLITDKGVEILTKRTKDSPSLGFDTKDDLYTV
ncbi:methionine aminopeptidase 1b, putative (METAP1b) [Plasmodium ovale wallikeri]|uniref:Methionine aminopeptidase n=2 Tax=Plasmodium ovale TaxID=36330 RepID=A0A1A9A371_PLAOA|nr:methionine aminopeptidase 1b, putative (METAP1b) [Plasmodium ovale wallikeri]SBT50647.1 methionine aminopeptidase 1b, putative (METAP1b) [Plasmodium ovale wallikeri]SBT76721.1 methionine aminopeptidase 1b, putative [Plasmodium ovale]